MLTVRLKLWNYEVHILYFSHCKVNIFLWAHCYQKNHLQAHKQTKKGKAIWKWTTNWTGLEGAPVASRSHGSSQLPGLCPRHRVHLPRALCPEPPLLGSHGAFGKRNRRGKTDWPPDLPLPSNEQLKAQLSTAVCLEQGHSLPKRQSSLIARDNFLRETGSPETSVRWVTAVSPCGWAARTLPVSHLHKSHGHQS